MSPQCLEVQPLGLSLFRNQMFVDHDFTPLVPLLTERLTAVPREGLLEHMLLTDDLLQATAKAAAHHFGDPHVSFPLASRTARA
jgi:hypothetical protein